MENIVNQLWIYMVLQSRYKNMVDLENPYTVL